MSDPFVAHRRLLLSCADRPGIVAEVSALLADAGANITGLDEHADQGRFAMRVQFTVSEVHAEALERELRFMAAQRLGAELLRLHDPAQLPRVAVLCSKEDHCAADLLWRFARGELPGRLHCLISTSHELSQVSAGSYVRFHHLPVTSRAEMPAHEQQLLERLAGQVDLVVLARYMRVLSGEFLQALGCPAINIHHSFLPAFKGAGPYQRAHARGVKLIGATAHYVTAELDEGPIIEQEVARVSHRDQPEDLVRIGRDIERIVLARAVLAHLQDRVVTWGERTIVFP